MQPSPTQAKSPSPQWMKYLLAGAVLLIDLYLVMLMYSQGEYLFAILTLVILTSGVYIFSNKKTYAWRYVYPGITGMSHFHSVSIGCHHCHCVHQLQRHQPTCF